MAQQQVEQRPPVFAPLDALQYLDQLVGGEELTTGARAQRG